jgi:hypothetical protein
MPARSTVRAVTQPLPPAGYYPDPSGAPQQRFWDGAGWTARTQAFQPPTTAPAPSAAAYPATAYPATTYPATAYPATTYPPTGGPATTYPPTAYPAATYPATTYPPTDAGSGAPTGIVGPSLAANGALGAIVGSILTAAAEQAAHARTSAQDRGVLGAGQEFYRDHQRAVDTAAGGALLAEGLVGLDRPGRDGRPGIGGALKGLVVGLVFTLITLGVALLSEPRDIPNAVSTRGVVTAMRTTSSTDGRTCAIEAEYVVDGTTYTVSPNYSSSTLCGESRGSFVDVKYDPADPGNAIVPESLGLRLIPWGMFAVGLVITVCSAVQVVRRAVALGTGGWLLWRGLRRPGSRQA